MTAADQYVCEVIRKYAVNCSAGSPAQRAASSLVPLLRSWADGHLLDMGFSGSYAKGTAISLGTDIDLFLSLAHGAGASVKDIYWSLMRHLESAQLHPQAQNVSIGVRMGGVRVDVVPGRKQLGNTTDHTLYRRKADTWIQTNVAQHIKLVSGSGRTDEIRALKTWRQLRKLDFPSFYLELTVLDALKGRPLGQPANNIRVVLGYLTGPFVGAVVRDPANTNNRISDDLDLPEKRRIADAAHMALAARTWGEILW